MALNWNNNNLHLHDNESELRELLLCIKSGDNEKLKELLDLDPHPGTVRDCLDLALTIERSNIEAIRLLLEHDETLINNTKPTFLSNCAFMDPRILQELLNHGWDINRGRMNARVLAITRRHENSIKWFLERGAHPNYRGSGASIALGYLLEDITTSQINILDLLRQNGGDIGPSTRFRMSSIPQENEMKFSLLFDWGMSPNAISPTGDTLLHIAVSQKNYETVEWLLRNGADVSIQDRIGRTPAVHAREICSTEIYDLIKNFQPSESSL